MRGYRGRFAPSPTGPLHAGSLVAALASWLDARAHGGVWLVRIEDIDAPRCVPGAAERILAQLAACGLESDEPPVYQSQRGALYQAALDRLIATGMAYPCGCSRSDVERANAALGRVVATRGAGRVYPGTCRAGLDGRAARVWRLRTDRIAPAVGFSKQKSAFTHVDAGSSAIEIIENQLVWHDRRLGVQRQNVEAAVGDFVLRRGDGQWAYQLAVVVDDAAQQISDVVRGADLADNTARQIWLQRALGLATPRYLHTPLRLGANGEKLSKQNGAAPLDTDDPRAALNAAASLLGLPARPGDVPGLLAAWTDDWRARFGSLKKAATCCPTPQFRP